MDAAPSVETGRAILDSRTYDLLITDARLPYGSGLMLADTVGERGIHALIVTGNIFAIKLNHAKIHRTGQANTALQAVAAVGNVLGQG